MLNSFKLITYLNRLSENKENFPLLISVTELPMDFKNKCFHIVFLLVYFISYFLNHTCMVKIKQNHTWSKIKKVYVVKININIQGQYIFFNIFEIKQIIHYTGPRLSK